MAKIKLHEIFLEWFKQTNPHLYKKGTSNKERQEELTEYVNDVLQEHMEQMQEFCIDNFEKDDESEEE